VYNRRTVSIITPPASPPVSVAEVKGMLVLTGTEDDNLIAAFIEAATDAARQYLRRSIVTETLELRMDGFPGHGDEAVVALGPGMHTAHYPSLVNWGGKIDLPFGPVQSVVSITTWNRANVDEVFDADNYELGQDDVYLNEGRTWPVNLRHRNAVAVRYVSGYDPVPEAVRQGIKQHVLAMYECREGCEMPPACRAIFAGYRRVDALGWS